ncbi:hypothetical protein [Rathayibacter rathayi]|uniref:hypothetical protein n=1 Tax=Rathayibacter rathayi TaxID=33887 RepID=UPI000FDC8640|nr:hypothetical protein [Rathayibacter rathayi]AZZ47781.1 hypothetical protein C1O28_00030 [Rathayibacter rathayi]
MTILLDLSLVSGVLVVSVYLLAVTALLLLLTVHIRSRGSGRTRRGVVAVATLLLGLLGGMALAALVGGSEGPSASTSPRSPASGSVSESAASPSPWSCSCTPSAVGASGACSPPSASWCWWSRPPR